MEARGDSHRSRIKFSQTSSEIPMPKKSVTLPLDVFQHIFDFLAVPTYERDPSPILDAIYRNSITPMLPQQHFRTLLSLSLTCKSLREMVLPMLLRYLLITSGSELNQLLSMMTTGRQNPIESLVIQTLEENRSIRQITGEDFLRVVEVCTRLRALKIVSPLLLHPPYPGILQSLARCGTLANITSVELYLCDYHYEGAGWVDEDEWYEPEVQCYEPTPDCLAQLVRLMPKLTDLHVLQQHPPISLARINSPPTPLPFPPPFQLEYLTVDHSFWNRDLNWLTSTSHNSLKSATFVTTFGRSMLLNLDHPWTALRHLHMLGNLRELMVETVQSCSNLVDLALEVVLPCFVEKEESMMRCFNALRIPLQRFTLICRPPIADQNESYHADCAFLASAILNHPKLCELEAMTVELPFFYHQSQCVYQDVMPRIREACEARGIPFTITCGNEPKRKTTYYR